MRRVKFYLSIGYPSAIQEEIMEYEDGCQMKKSKKILRVGRMRDRTLHGGT